MRKDKTEPLFPHLRAAMRANQEASRALPDMTYYRYARGELPVNLTWFLEHPDMLAALLEDAQTMTDADRRRFARQAKERGKAAKARRDK